MYTAWLGLKTILYGAVCQVASKSLANQVHWESLVRRNDVSVKDSQRKISEMEDGVIVYKIWNSQVQLLPKVDTCEC